VWSSGGGDIMGLFKDVLFVVYTECEKHPCKNGGYIMAIAA
jgi:hypothetical protein